MLTVIIGKTLYILGGVLAGWLGKKWHVAGILDAVAEEAERRRLGMPPEPPKTK